MDDQSVILAVDGAVATVTLNRPDKLNSFTAEMHARLRDALDRVADNPAIGALVITGAGRGFCAGQDLADPALGEIADGIDLGVAVERDYNPMIRRIAALPLPVIAAVNGVAAGAGANLALAADIVLAARGAKFIQSFAAIGLIPDTGGSYHLPRLVGQARALGLALT
ncbi:MAG: enoyl-CoA hydratase-related protein, partial [Pseudomonadota bacterium]|nr:enoyl-CoA hydratase-related protein [Pseudomonadota bacterium]